MLENKKTIVIERNNRKVEFHLTGCEIYWNTINEYILYIADIKVNDRVFDVSINNCKLICDNDKNYIKIYTNIKNRNVEDLYSYLSGHVFQNADYLGLNLKNKEDIEKFKNFIIECRLGIKKKEEVQKLFELAKETGEKQEITRWTEPCNNPNEECNLDSIVLYAMPDGSKKKERYHTW